MRFTTRTQYGLRFLLRLALLPEGELLPLSDAARAENISSGYLEQIVRALKPLGILHGARGNGGGYRLAKKPDEINMEDIFRQLEGCIAPVDCLSGARQCPREEVCGARGFWHALDLHMRGFLRERTLGDVCRQCLREEDCRGNGN